MARRPATRPRGRPPLVPGQRSIEVAGSITELEAAELQAIATAERVSVASLVREACRAFIRLRRRALATSTPRRERSVSKSAY